MSVQAFGNESLSLKFRILFIFSCAFLLLGQILPNGFPELFGVCFVISQGASDIIFLLRYKGGGQATQQGQALSTLIRWSRAGMASQPGSPNDP